MRFVAVGELTPGMRIGRKIIDKRRTPMIEKGIVLNQNMIDHLVKNGYLGAYIVDRFSDEIEIQETVKEKTIESGIDAVSEANVGSIIEVASDLVKDISSLKRISVDMFDLRSFDDYTYHHSVNVAVYAVSVATKMGLPEEQIQEVAVAALCHDLGKSKIDTNILNKRASLTDEEFEIIKKHPRYGYDMLYDNFMVSSPVRQAVMCHHENENGSGYPNGMAGEEIPLYAKIIHAVDVYDALTSRRPYKGPYSPVDALEYMTCGIDILFDAKVVAAMKEVIPAYPPGMDVTLSNGEKAVVIAHTSQALRPKIKLYSDGLEIDLCEEKAFANIFIVDSGFYKDQEGGEDGKVEKLNDDRGKEREALKTILVVDDNKTSLLQTKAALGNKYNIVGLDNGLACLNYFKVKGAPDLLIMDIDMPILNGMETVEKLREKNYDKLNVIFLTALASKEIVARCRRARAKDYILKPANPIYLKERVELAFDKTLNRE
ncbi:MAG: response regulator [Lachnospiraceae bacterium]|nr:response regulator [Lachnospiraceae bacterium]